VEAGAVPLLVDLLSGGSEEGRAAAAFALGSLADSNDDSAADIVEAGAVPLLVDLLSGGSERGRAAAAKAS
jgi:HEAT repeat protein